MASSEKGEYRWSADGPRRPRLVTYARERLAQLGGVDPDEDDGTPARAPVHETFEGTEAEVQLLVRDLEDRADTSHYREPRRRIEATGPWFAPITDDEWREMFSDLEPATEDDVPWRFPVRTPLIDDDRPGV